MTNRRERERQRHYDEILDAAEQEFVQKGFHGTTVEAVAERAEFAVGTLYNFFASKEILYQKLHERRFGDFSETANAALDEASNPVEMIRAYIQVKIDLCYRFEPFVKLYMRERLSDRFSQNSLWTELAGPLFEQIWHRLMEAFREGIEHGDFRSDISPEDMVIALEGLSDGFMYEWIADSQRVKFNEKYEQIMAMFMEGVKRR